MTLMKKLSSLILGNLENFFFWWGTKVTNYPFIVITTCMVMTGLSAVGFLKFRFDLSQTLLIMFEIILS